MLAFFNLQRYEYFPELQKLFYRRAVEGSRGHLVFDVDQLEGEEGSALVEEETEEDFIALPKGE